MKKFVNRNQELKKLDQVKPGLIVLFGRRRLGKTTLIERWGRTRNLHYTQAIEGGMLLQLEQIRMDFASLLPEGIVPRTWLELFAALKTVNKDSLVVIDEFPYLVTSNPELPSIIQRWMDHDRPRGMSLALLGSSQSMMHGIFLDPSSPLYERANLILKIEAMSYAHFCSALDLDSSETKSFLKFSMIGGIPRYWQFAEDLDDPLELAQFLFFDRAARLEDEPDRLLKDEAISGQQAKAILESIGRGAAKPSEIAQRMGIPQTGLSKPLQILMGSSLINRSIPFGESARNSKKTIYSIRDYALRFWYQVYSPHRSRWHLYAREAKLKLIHDHAAKVLEDEIRNLYRDASPYWEGQLAEFDSVRHDPKDLKKVIITEIKFKDVSAKDRQRLAQSTEQKFHASRLAQQYGLGAIEILDQGAALDLLAHFRSQNFQ